MIQSMTGFGSAEKNGFRVDIRSLNHRHTEIFVKMPSFILEHEMAIRNLLKDKFKRGRFDVNISLPDKQQTRIKANTKIAGEIYRAFDDLKRELSLDGSIDLQSMLIFKELILTEDIEYSSDDLFGAVNGAISSLYEMRAAEGEGLMEGMDSILKNLGRIHNQIENCFNNSIHLHRDSLLRKISDLLSTIPLDEARLSQEIAFIAQKSDITEELARIKCHIEQFGFVLSRGDEAGRRLDFILQEILREANTITSKTDILDIINLAIDIKTEVEKLREQSQNIQ